MVLSPITSGHVLITLGGGESEVLDQEAQDLAAVLRIGGLAAPIRLVEEGPAPR
jgi:preprotein translocase subunit SecD